MYATVRAGRSRIRTLNPSGLSPLVAPVNGWGPVELDRSNGEAAGGDGALLTVGGVSWARGLGVHAASDVRYSVPAGSIRRPGPGSRDRGRSTTLDRWQGPERRHLASLCVDVCNENGWVIPFPQLTVHVAPRSEG